MEDHDVSRMDDHQFVPEDFNITRDLAPVRAQVVLKCLYMARIGRAGLLLTVNWLTRSVSFCVSAWICAPQATDLDPQSFNVNAWICAQRATDRDLESFVNAWICTCQATDRDLQSVFFDRKVNAWMCACQATDRDLEGVSK